MVDSSEVYCLNAYDNLGNFLCTLRCGQPSEIGQDYDYLIPNVGNREVDYICYTDKCGNCCRLDNENELIIHSTQGEIKTFTLSASRNCIGLKWSEIYGGNWCRTLILYKTGSYPTSISDGTIAVEELTKNQYCTNTYWKTGLAYVTTYYVKAFALDGSNNIIGSKCGTITTGTDFITTCWGYTGAQQTVSLSAGTYKLEVWGASGGQGVKTVSGTCVPGCGGYSQGCLTLTSTTTLYLYVGGCGGSSAGGGGGWNGGGNSGTSSCSACYAGGGGGATDIRIGGNTLCYRRIVAGGGGGKGISAGSYGGTGGGCCGGNGYTSDSYGCRTGCGGTQTAGGATGTQGGNAGSFGNGGAGQNGCGGGAGGGGGWYGGGGGSCGAAVAGAAGGGSGYVYNSSTCVNVPTGYVHNTSYFLINSCSCCGLCSFPTPAGGVETGHSGNGCIKISPI